MPRLLFVFGSLCFLLLPSCMYWDIGGNIRALAERHVAVDPSLQYRCGDVVVAPECSYHGTPWVVSLVFPHNYAMKYYTYGEEFTGRYRVVEREHRYLTFNDAHPFPVGELYEVQGKGLQPISEASGDPLPTGEQHAEEAPAIASPRAWWVLRNAAGEEVTERSAWYPVAAAVAAPFDYVVDPVLIVVTAPIAWLYIVIDTLCALAC